ncbi:MAG: BatA domain-containing protein [Bacteroidales bacterium]|nr:BatA domain-containing protein [Bacteroidales bacterium]
MQFTQPLFLIGYAAILVPILIHLFNFRRYRTYYFSNVRMLQDVVQKTKRESQVKQLIVLTLRCLFIIALVTAFARPYLPSHDKVQKNGNLVSIYVDNSFSMEGNTLEGTLFLDGIANARQIVSHFDYSDQFVLYNNDFSSKQRCKLNKEEALQELESWNISSNTRSWKDLLAFEKNACTASDQMNVFHYYISDFQKNNFDFFEFSHQDGSASYLIHKPAKEINNVSVDSCWFLSPVFREGQQVTLTVRLCNYGDVDVVKLPLKLHVNGEQKAMAAVDIAAGGSANYQLNYTLTGSGIQNGVLSIDDAPITFDNQLYFTYRVSDNTNITVIDEKTPNRYLHALYGMDSVFSCTTMPSEKINYSAFGNSSVIVLDEVERISSGLADELSKYVNNGGTLLIFPSLKMEYGSWNSFLSQLGAPQFGAVQEQEMKVGSINAESIYFKGSLEDNNSRLDMPTALKYFTFNAFQSDETIMTFENQAPLLFVSRAGKGRVILSAVAMNDEFGNIHRHALFFIPLHNIGIRSLMQQKLYNVLGTDHSQNVAKSVEGSENVLVLKALEGGEEIVPEQRNLGNEVVLFFGDNITQAGIYQLLQDGGVQGAVAFNFDRKESQLSYYKEDELQNVVSDMPKEEHVQLIHGEEQDISGKIAQTIHGVPLWIYFVFAALFFLAAEIAVLRLWRRKTSSETV